MSSRRSFLAAIAGALAAPALAKMPAPTPAPRRLRFPSPSVDSPVYQSFIVSEEFTIEPGVSQIERLFPPPTPPHVLIEGIWFSPREDIRWADLMELMGEPRLDDDEAAPGAGVVVSVKRGAQTMIAAPMRYFPGTATPCRSFSTAAFPYAFDAGDDLGVYVQSEALNLQAPAHLFCYLSGLIRSGKA